MGDPIYDDLKHQIPDIEGVKLTALSKTMLIQRLIVALEQQKISWPVEWDDLTAEMRRFEYQIMPSGGIQYNAPSGYHDDCVISLALANHGRWAGETVGTMRALAPGWRHGGWEHRRVRALDG